MDADFLRAKQKVKRGTDFRDTVEVDVGGDPIEFGFRLLNEGEWDRVETELPLDELQGGDAQPLDEDERGRLEELDGKDNEELTQAEEEELVELAQRSGVQRLFEALDEDANDVLRWAGRKAIFPTPEDVEEVLQSTVAERVEVLGQDVVERLNGDADHDRHIVETAIADSMEEWVCDQPYPIQKTVGLRAFIESLKVRGNGVDSSETT